jgi:hypothetical protein
LWERESRDEKAKYRLGLPRAKTFGQGTEQPVSIPQERMRKHIGFTHSSPGGYPRVASTKHLEGRKVLM